jgi:hypothetical protein
MLKLSLGESHFRQDWGYGLTTASGFVTLKRSFCLQCMNFACPLNNVSEKTRADFFKRNPTVTMAWGRVSD